MSEFREEGGSSGGGGDCSRLQQMPVDGFDLPLGVTSHEFSLYVAVDADVQTATEVTDEELCTGQQAAGDVDTDGETSSEATVADDSGQQRTLVTLSSALLGLDTVSAYLEMAGCESYESLYALIDQVHGITTKHSLQKTMTDFFA